MHPRPVVAGIRTPEEKLAVRVDVTCRVKFSEFDNWSREQVVAFFDGIGEVLATQSLTREIPALQDDES